MYLNKDRYTKRKIKKILEYSTLKQIEHILNKEFLETIT